MGHYFPNLSLRLHPVLNGMAVVTAFLLIEFIGSFGNLWGYVNRFRGHGVRHAPFDHRNLQGIVHDKARDHRIGEYRERLVPRQWFESWEAHKRQDGAYDRVSSDG